MIKQYTPMIWGFVKFIVFLLVFLAIPLKYNSKVNEENMNLFKTEFLKLHPLTSVNELPLYIKIIIGLGILYVGVLAITFVAHKIWRFMTIE